MRKLYACGGIYSTIHDVNRWLGSLPEGAILSEDSFQTICSPVTPNYGYGCRVKEGAGCDSYAGVMQRLNSTPSGWYDLFAWINRATRNRSRSNPGWG